MTKKREHLDLSNALVDFLATGKFYTFLIFYTVGIVLGMVLTTGTLSENSMYAFSFFLVGPFVGIVGLYIGSRLVKGAEGLGLLKSAFIGPLTASRVVAFIIFYAAGSVLGVMLMGYTDSMFNCAVCLVGPVAGIFGQAIVGHFTDKGQQQKSDTTAQYLLAHLLAMMMGAAIVDDSPKIKKGRKGPKKEKPENR